MEGAVQNSAAYRIQPFIHYTAYDWGPIAEIQQFKGCCHHFHGSVQGNGQFLLTILRQFARFQRKAQGKRIITAAFQVFL